MHPDLGRPGWGQLHPHIDPAPCSSPGPPSPPPRLCLAPPRLCLVPPRLCLAPAPPLVSPPPPPLDVGKDFLRLTPLATLTLKITNYAALKAYNPNFFANVNTVWIGGVTLSNPHPLYRNDTLVDLGAPF